ncbi:hypothetical protein GUITHDRAFT_120132 [Guillardia theta CCMP2712]|uniref:EF-hand domain-containing protein n=1 Tax=Guillardia theta (strain CCMP2712) TaxID=905079 RepID=L1IC55_GUITC|nr:hypothetical protein GUITHDRAFT_120132 [Guillardia theta CCMP2712]EKX33682.1 hypothetical protein GUITHDRAFT_120132 [Guillardia theta CCMP2712]|eukprot:XP_005820662.1 hypothetical protein GUITHDRAFT_120132 [Guillardia theta CCMP2712]
MGMQPRKGELQQTLEVACPLSDGSRISKEEFTAIMMRFLARRDSATRLMQDFDTIDYGSSSDDAKASLTLKIFRDFRRMLKGNLDQIRIRNFDKDGDGKWKFDEFVTALGYELERKRGIENIL